MVTTPRKRLRLTLGGMMLLVLVLGGCLGWVAHRARVQRLAVAAILKDRTGGVRYDWEFKDDKIVPNGKPWGPKWLREALGPDVFDSVVFVWINGTKLDDTVMANLAKLDRVQSLNIQGGPAPRGLTSAGMERLRSLPHLSRLTVQGLGESSGFIAGLEGNTQLRKLWLQSAAVTDDQMAILDGLSGLEELLINGRNITEAGYAHLARLKKLKQLEIANGEIRDLTPVSGLSSLEILCFHRLPGERGERGSTSLAPLRGLIKLKRLELRTVWVDDRDLEYLKDLKKLWWLGIGGRGITDAGLSRIAELPALAFLYLDDTSIRDLSNLAPAFPRLRSISMDTIPLNDEGIRPLASALLLGQLSLKDCSIGDAGMAHLKGMTGLRSLSLHRTGITDAGLANLSGLSGLQSLFLMRTKVTDAGMASLVSLPKLATLALSDDAITDAAVADLCKLPSCTSLILYGTKISPAGEKRLKNAIPGLRITKLNPDLLR